MYDVDSISNARNAYGPKASVMSESVNFLRLSDTLVSTMGVTDCNERMVSLQDLDERIYLDDSEANQVVVGYAPIFYARESVSRRLLEALLHLPSHVSLLVKEAYRPMSRQAFSFARHLQRVSAEHAGLSNDELVAIASHYVAPPWVAGHPTGGAIDVTLCDRDGHELPLGCPYDADEVSSEGRCFSFASAIDALSMRNREMLFTSLTRGGFVNYPYEWWHWSFGDKYWAAATGSPSAIYDVCREGSVDHRL